MIEVKSVHTQDTIIRLENGLMLLDEKLHAFGREKEEMLSLFFFVRREGQNMGISRGDLVARLLKSQERLLKWRLFNRKKKLVKCYSDLLKIISISENIQFDVVKYLSVSMGIPLTEFA